MDIKQKVEIGYKHALVKGTWWNHNRRVATYVNPKRETL